MPSLQSVRKGVSQSNEQAPIADVRALFGVHQTEQVHQATGHTSQCCNQYLIKVYNGWLISFVKLL